MNTTNYTYTDVNVQLRKVDLYIMGQPNIIPNVVQKSAPTLNVETGGQICAGIVKLSQKVVNVMLSYNVYYDFDWGTKLFPFIISGSATNIQAVLGTLLAAVAESVVSDISSGETDDAPLDELIKDMYSRSFTYSKADSRVVVFFDIVSQADIVTSIVVPISTVP